MAYDLLPPSGGQLAGVTNQTGSIKVKTPGKTVNAVRVHVITALSESSEELVLLYRKLNSLLNEGAIKARLSCYLCRRWLMLRSLFDMKCCPTVWQVFRRDWNVWKRAFFLA